MEIEHVASELIQTALEAGVSDIHILPLEEDYQVFFRVNGSLTQIKHWRIDLAKRLISYFKFAANMDVGERRKPQSGALRFGLVTGAVELRLSTMTNVHLLESLVIRILGERQLDTKIACYFPRDLPVLEDLVHRHDGLVLFSGPVGSGKTTTIYQLLRQRIEGEMIQVITMEDPVEIYEPRFLQTEVNPKAGISYAQLIRASLRHHPEVLMIGEIRDEETARMTVRGALTGHLMIATVHARDCLGVLARLQELQVSNEQLRQTLIGVVSQRLIPRLDRQLSASGQASDRMALFEILTGPELTEALRFQAPPQLRQPLNHRLRKAWSYGYISTQSYQKFEIL